MRALARRGLRCGSGSRAFLLRDLREALQDALLTPNNVYVELDGSGRLAARGGPAAVAVRARLAPAPPAAHLLLCVTPPAHLAAPSLALKLATEASPLLELQLWFDEAAIALLRLPHLTLRNIQGKNSYVCHDCGAEFAQPNPLKVHLFLSCGEYTRSAFWDLCIQRLDTSKSNVEHSPGSAFRPYALADGIWTAPASAPPLPLTLPSPAELEALAAAWGRSRGGHVCLYCGKLYSRKYGLKIHIRTHTGYKPLRCRHCLRAFGDPSNLNKHVRLHARAAPSAPHSCPRCGKPLARRRDLERHLRARHNGSPSPVTASTAHHIQDLAVP